MYNTLGQDSDFEPYRCCLPPRSSAANFYRRYWWLFEQKLSDVWWGGVYDVITAENQPGDLKTLLKHALTG